jgi:hypothetical protein
MGVDLRGIFQKKVGDRWEDIEPFQIDNRHYDLFGWLSWGGDRSGSCSFKPLAPERGFPDDFKCVPGDLYTMANGEKCPMGDAGHSWLLGSEILQATPPKLARTVVMTPEALEFHDDPECPPWQYAINVLFYGDPGPPHKTLFVPEGVKIKGAFVDFDFANVPELPRKNISVRENAVYLWMYDFAPEFRAFTDEVRRHADLHGEVRLVFGYS